MGETFAQVAVAAAFAFAIAWLIANARYEFWVKIRDGWPTVGRGKISGPFLQDLAEVIARHHVRRGWVGGVRNGRRIRLAFSRRIPEPCRQQLRNLWNMHRR